MEFFKRHFHNVDFEGKRGEVKVLCPFHHDENPSATVNADKSLFHCWVCNTGYNEEQFMAEIKGIPVSQAIKLLAEMSNHTESDWDVSFKAELWADEEALEKVRLLGFADDHIDAMRLGLGYTEGLKMLAIPVFYDGALMDIRRYNLFKHTKLHKMYSAKGAKSGWIIPYDIWKNDDTTTYIFEGEKDMLMGRQLGLNAITLTGGAGALPNEYCLPTFKGRDVVICYDNDEAGREGSKKVGASIATVANSVRLIDIGLVVSEIKEDFYDYIIKYGGDVYDFLSLPTTELTKVHVDKEYIPIREMLRSNMLKQEFNSQVVIGSEFVETFSVPTVIQATKVMAGSNDDSMTIGESKYWSLTEENVDDMLSLIEVDAKLKNVQQRATELVKLPKREEGIKLEFKNEKFVYRCTVTDIDSDGDTTSLDVYSFERLKVGAQYDITYRLFAHPTKHQKIIAIVSKAISMDDTSDFEPNPELLLQFRQNKPIAERVDALFKSTRAYVAPHMDFDIWLMSELVFNSILDFDYGGLMRGTLDVFILGDTQIGKSETTSRLVDLYKFGHFLSLKTSTTRGLVGGTHKVDGSNVIVMGAIPRQHKKLVVLEEFSGAEPEFIKTMTDIRSSNEIRIARVGSEIKAPCKLRMITISNPINDENGTPRYVTSFPNGVIPIMELIRSAEDVARYDGFLLAHKKDSRVNPFEDKRVDNPIPRACYVHKARWIETRKPEHVVFAENVKSYIWKKAEELNHKYECNVPIFGTTTSKKLARFSVALATLVMNTTDDCQKIIVTEEIVDYVCDFLDSIYGSPYFKLDKVKAEWEEYNVYTKKDIEVAEELYPANATLFEFLANQARTSRANLQAISGRDRDSFGTVFNLLVRHRFIRINLDSVYPTEKYRKVYVAMNKTVGEMVTRHSSVNYDL